jgi:hypothetical protein
VKSVAPKKAASVKPPSIPQKKTAGAANPPKVIAEGGSFFWVQDPPPTGFEKKLSAGRPFSHTVTTPSPDIDLTKGHWIGRRPSDQELRRMQFDRVGIPDSTTIGIPGDERHIGIGINPRDVKTVRNKVTHEIEGYEVHQGDTATLLDRNGGRILSSRGLEKPLEQPAVDPIDAVMIAADVGPIVAKGLAAGGKTVVKTLTRGAVREAAKAGIEEGSSVSTKVATKAIGRTQIAGGKAVAEGAGHVLEERMIKREAVNIGKEAEARIIRTDYPNARTLPPDYKAYDAVDGGTRTYRLRAERVRGQKAMVLEETVKGGEGISIKTVEPQTANPEGLKRVVQNAQRTMTEGTRPKRESIPLPNGTYYRLMPVKPKTAVLHIELPTRPTPELVAAAKNAVRDYGPGTPRLTIVLKGPPEAM